MSEEIKVENVRELLLYIRAIEDWMEGSGLEGSWEPNSTQWKRIKIMIESLSKPENMDTNPNPMEEKIDAILDVLSVLNDSIATLHENMDTLFELVQPSHQHHTPLASPTYQPQVSALDNNQQSHPPKREVLEHLPQRDSEGNPFNKDRIYDPEKSVFM